MVPAAKSIDAGKAVQIVRDISLDDVVVGKRRRRDLAPAIATPRAIRQSNAPGSGIVHGSIRLQGALPIEVSCP